MGGHTLLVLLLPFAFAQAQEVSAPPTAEPTIATRADAAIPRGVRFLQITAAGGTILVTDSQGRRLGQTAARAPILHEIPNAYFSENENPADETVAVDSSPQIAVAGIADARAGVYRITITATKTMSDGRLWVQTETPSGTYESSDVVLNLVKDSVHQFQVTYDPVAATPPAIVSLGAEDPDMEPAYSVGQAQAAQVRWMPPHVTAPWFRTVDGDTKAPTSATSPANDACCRQALVR
jgi:hypothetical protein